VSTSVRLGAGSAQSRAQKEPLELGRFVPFADPLPGKRCCVSAKLYPEPRASKSTSGSAVNRNSRRLIQVYRIFHTR
jgi:hypothetical protein